MSGGDNGDEGGISDREAAGPMGNGDYAVGMGRRALRGEPGDDLRRARVSNVLQTHDHTIMVMVADGAFEGEHGTESRLPHQRRKVCDRQRFAGDHGTDDT
ncbi:hypothetical protein GCM10009619_41500 [Williamsia maris]